MQYDIIVIDTLNVLYKSQSEQERPEKVNKKLVYKNLIINFIKNIQYLKNTFGGDNTEIILLFDNAKSKINLQDSMYFNKRKTLYDNYKSNRKENTKEFYNSLDLIRYYYLIQSKNYKTIKIANVEADDLVKPLLKLYKDKTALLISNDEDWYRYLSPKVHAYPSFKTQEVYTEQKFLDTHGYVVNEDSLILQKALFGDKSDNITGLITYNETNKDLFTKFLSFYLHEGKVLFGNIIIDARVKFKDEQFGFIYEAIKNYENQFNINVQIISAIPISEEHIISATCIGRDVKKIKDIIEKTIGLTQEKYTFGNIKKPRV